MTFTKFKWSVLAIICTIASFPCWPVFYLSEKYGKLLKDKGQDKVVEFPWWLAFYARATFFFSWLFWWGVAFGEWSRMEDQKGL
jgi:hypothetical protein